MSNATVMFFVFCLVRLVPIEIYRKGLVFRRIYIFRYGKSVQIETYRNMFLVARFLRKFKTAAVEYEV